MTDLRKAAQQALEVLEIRCGTHAEERNTGGVIPTLRAALAQPADMEPVAWLFQNEETGLTECVDVQQVEWGFEKNNPRWQKIAPLYTHPPARVPLTEDDLHRLVNEFFYEGMTPTGKHLKNFAHAIIAAYEAKNNIKE